MRYGLTTVTTALKFLLQRWRIARYPLTSLSHDTRAVACCQA